MSEIYGRGTNSKQTTEVKGFYTEVRQLLSNALKDYLAKQVTSFAEGLLKQAEDIQPKISSELMSQLDIRIEAIQSNLSNASGEEKARVTKYLTESIDGFRGSLSRIN